MLFRSYQRENLPGDVVAGIIVAIMLVPQGMAYALLAGLPPQVGLYASIVPLMIYGLLGSSRALSVGPTAMVSLLVASGLAHYADGDTSQYIALSLILALEIGIIQLLMGLFRVGFLVNFLSHPVLSGFTSAAALIIGFSQLKHITGLSIPRSEQIIEIAIFAGESLSQIDVTTLVLSLASLAILLFFKYGMPAIARRFPPAFEIPLTKTGPLLVVMLGTILAAILQPDMAIVGEVPRGLPYLTMPALDLELWQEMLPIALTISVLGYMESISVAKSLASRKRQKINANQELLALGAANVGSAFTGGYPVTGGFSRSLVNYSAGSNSGLASIITAVLVGLTVLVLTPLFYYLPNAILATIIIVAVAGLIDLKTVRHTWQYSKVDFASLLITFVAVLGMGIESGIIVGVVSSLVLHIWRTSRPHIAIVGRVGSSEHFRNVKRHSVTTYPHIVSIRVDESLYFPNAQYLQNFILEEVADHEEVACLVLVCSAVNYIDVSALDMLEHLREDLKRIGVELYLAEVKGPVFDRLQRVGFVDELGEDHIFLSLHQAMEQLTWRLAERVSDGTAMPPVYRDSVQGDTEIPAEVAIP
jgi:SulP family sulfate permease